MQQPVMSVQFSDLYKYDTYANYLQAMQPRAVMWLVGGEQLSKSGAYASYDLCPNSWIVLRFPTPETAFTPEQLDGDLDLFVQRWADVVGAFLPFAKDRARTIAHGPFCEFADWGRFDKLTTMETKLVKVLWEAYGLRSVIGNFSVGCPPVELLPRYVPALRAAKKYGGVLGLHQYMQLYAGDEAEWTSCRHWKWASVFQDQEARVGIFVTETGIDDVHGNNPPVLARLTNGARTPGWITADTPFRWRGEPASRTLEDIYVGELQSLDMMYRDPVMFGSQVVKASFVFISQKSQGGFENFNLERVMPRLTNWIGNTPSTKLTSLNADDSLDNAPTPPTPPPPPSGTKRTTANLRLRSGPSTSYQRITIMPSGTLVKVLEISSGWARVEVTLDVWELPLAVDAADYKTWQKQERILAGWCSMDYLA